MTANDLDAAQDFLTSILWTGHTVPPRSDLKHPYVTLTFAQSLDGKIAGKGGKQLILSGKESMLMTHWMRSMHDAILIGIGTALNDDPQLNIRHIPTSANRSPPRPIILDSKLRLQPKCKLLNNYQQGAGLQPWIICSPLEPDKDKRREDLESAGAKVIEVRSHNNLVSIDDLLKTLFDLGINTLMVEGGASIIASFLAQASQVDGSGTNHAVDMLIVTVAPTIVGEEGVGYEHGGGNLPPLQLVRTTLFGRDTVIACKLS
ncbi:dihydrofolate reductase-like domain-containing protein [Hygrophoropsis aurantiaca]|uniref:Dihydrofolate reductase-like domain-containing protein n=1 Tax=Hygrophoropsis aurantiaca TaxID=72124 RepID=A0ACB8AMF2_9AGAM|nr:dihydrofolate reductase-like domain-containing protein [Hygrophoropsis aurantiaca]